MFGNVEEVVDRDTGRASTSPSPSASSSDHSDLSDDEAPGDVAVEPSDATHPPPVKKSVSMRGIRYQYWAPNLLLQ